MLSRFPFYAVLLCIFTTTACAAPDDSAWAGYTLEEDCQKTYCQQKLAECGQEWAHYYSLAGGIFESQHSYCRNVCTSADYYCIEEGFEATVADANPALEAACVQMFETCDPGELAPYEYCAHRAELGRPELEAVFDCYAQNCDGIRACGDQEGEWAADICALGEECGVTCSDDVLDNLTFNAVELRTDILMAVDEICRPLSCAEGRGECVVAYVNSITTF